MDDYTLIREYADHGSESAFAEIVKRHAAFVISLALRQTRNSDAAQDIAQSVFILLSRKASGFNEGIILSAWLFRTTRLVVAGWNKRETRRLIRERKAADMNEFICQNEDRILLDQTGLFLDEALACLRTRDREAVLLHFFEKYSYREVGLALGATEDAARKRIARALEKMRLFLFKRHQPISGTALAGLLLTCGAQAAPAGMVEQMASLASNSAAALNETVVDLVEETLRRMFWTKTKVALFGGIACLGAAGFLGWHFWFPEGTILKFSGMSDASAALPLEQGLFIVADDELNALNVYRRDRGGVPMQTFNFELIPAAKEGKNEADWEGAARIGDRTYWITSHGQNKEGKDRPSRHRLMAADLAWQGNQLLLSPAGRPYTNLLNDLLGDMRLASFNLGEAAKRAPKTPAALNIEGLAATPNAHLLIGFRNPIPQGCALLVPLLNPDGVIENGENARFDTPVLLDLGGLGIRDITFANGRYWILAGPFDGTGACRLFTWPVAGGPATLCDEITLNHLTPEAMLVYSDIGPRQMLVLSDDGTLKTGGRTMKTLPPVQRIFRGQWITIPAIESLP